MTMIEDIKLDREAGTDGPWEYTPPTQGDKYDAYEGLLGNLYGGSKCICDFGDNEAYCNTSGIPPIDEDARRIARVPDMEAALIAAEELARDVAEFQRRVSIGEIRSKKTQSAFAKSLAAYREATT